MASKTGVTRDRAGTEKAIVEAARQVLAEDGFAAFGVNVIARRAGCDKQLLYRYYGGLDGLVDAIGADLAALFTSLMPEPAETAFPSYAAFIEHLVSALLDAFRSSDLLLRIAAWEVFDPSPMTVRLATARGRALAEWVEARRGALLPPPGVDAGATNAILIAAVQHLVLSSKAVGAFGGITLATDDDWGRVRAVLQRFVRASYEMR